VSFRRWRCIRPLTSGEEGGTGSKRGRVSDMSGAYATNRTAPHQAEGLRVSRADDPGRAT
jgi:hypothetical protein